ncbi:MAG: sigma 54-interacting transcriptional regulator [Chitinispirillaceae bacterium]|nr:sigma 54-interacting transcriptional regulator [Chitinispirillaceae bacterium]
MKANNLNIAELIQFSPGFVGIQGRRLLIHDLLSLGQFRRDLIESVGINNAQRILTRKGLFWGQADCAGMKRLFTWENSVELLKAVPELIKITGMAYAQITELHLDERTGRLIMELKCADSSEVEQHRVEMGKSEFPICWAMAGYLSGYASYCLGREIYFREVQCQGAEMSSCIFIGKDADSWGKELETCLSFFHAADIQRKIESLTECIREQQQKILLHNKQLKAVLKQGEIFGIETRSKAFSNVLDFANKVAQFDTTVLITGETGTGKEVIARQIHAMSVRKKYPFIAINCSALPDSLLENELFGHKAGAFTGAKSNEMGLFEAANKGTIFLDEIGDISLSLQVKLLRVLQSKEIRPVGETHSQVVDFRVISATNRDLDLLVQNGTFREDLLYRLRVLHLALPPLRERQEDILPLARYFLDQFRKKLKIPALRFAPETVDVLTSYSWPGNVRELENALEHAAVLCTDGVITPDILPKAISGRKDSKNSTNVPLSLDEIEKRHIRSILELTSGNRTEAAKILKISESTLYRRLREL